VLRLIVVPQAMRVILPPLTNQYLNLTKNSSLAVAIGYPDLVSVFAGTTLSQTGQAIEIIAITMGVYLLISLVTSAIMSFYGWRIGRSMGCMSDIARFILSSARTSSRAPAPVKTTGFVGFLRTRLFNSPTNILITIVSALLLWFTVIPALKFLLIDAVWSGKDRTACLAENAGHAVGACWPFIQAKFSQFIYGFYPEAERWRVNLTVHSRRAPAAAAADSAAAGQGPQRRPVLYRIFRRRLLPAAWRRIGRFRRQLDGRTSVRFQRQHRRCGPQAGERRRGTAVIGPLLWLLGKLIVLLSHAMISYGDLAADLAARSDSGSGRPVWDRFRATAAIVSIAAVCG
jgi:hypothetical protein